MKIHTEFYPEILGIQELISRPFIQTTRESLKLTKSAKLEKL